MTGNHEAGAEEKVLSHVYGSALLLLIRSYEYAKGTLVSYLHLLLPTKISR